MADIFLEGCDKKAENRNSTDINFEWSLNNNNTHCSMQYIVCLSIQDCAFHVKIVRAQNHLILLMTPHKVCNHGPKTFPKTWWGQFSRYKMKPRKRRGRPVRKRFCSGWEAFTALKTTIFFRLSGVSLGFVLRPEKNIFESTARSIRNKKVRWENLSLNTCESARMLSICLEIFETFWNGGAAKPRECSETFPKIRDFFQSIPFCVVGGCGGGSVLWPRH